MNVYPVTAPVWSGQIFATTQRLRPPDRWIWSLDNTNIKSLDRVVAGDDLRGIPPWRISIGYSRNYTVQSRDAIAGGVSDTLVQFFTNEYRYVRQDNSVTLQKFPRAQQLTINTNVTSDPTSELAAYFLGLLVAPADVFQVTIAMSLADSLLDNSTGRNIYGMQLGRIVKLTYPRFYLGSGFFGMVIGYISDYIKREMDLFLWVKQ
jgi:hypothetical protein